MRSSAPGSMCVGAVGGLRGVRAATAAAAALELTTHSLLVGGLGRAMGLERSNLTTPASAALHAHWRAAGCHPNFWRIGGLAPDPRAGCGSFAPVPPGGAAAAPPPWASERAHDTVAMIVLAADGALAAGCSTNCAIHKVPGRVGDCAIAGARNYADADAGACGSTGDGDAHILLCALRAGGQRAAARRGAARGSRGGRAPHRAPSGGIHRRARCR